MKKFSLICLLVLASQAQAKNMQECKNWVESNLATFAVCYPHGSVKNDWFYRYTVYSCKPTKSNITCIVAQNFPSSGCEQEIYMDKRCQFNVGAKITDDRREDI